MKAVRENPADNRDYFTPRPSIYGEQKMTITHNNVTPLMESKYKETNFAGTT